MVFKPVPGDHNHVGFVKGPYANPITGRAKEIEVPVKSEQPVAVLLPIVVLTEVVYVAIVQPEPDVPKVPQTSTTMFDKPSQLNGVVNTWILFPVIGE